MPKMGMPVRRRAVQPSWVKDPTYYKPMKMNKNKSITASPRGGVESNMSRIWSTVTRVNAIRLSRLTSLLAIGEVNPMRKDWGIPMPNTWWVGEGVRVVGDSRSEMGCTR